MIEPTTWTCYNYAPGFLDDCRRAAVNPEIFSKFRQMHGICAIVENRPDEWAAQMMEAAVGAGVVSIDQLLSAARINDSIGTPRTTVWQGHELASTTASYLLHLAMFRLMFGSLAGRQIAEIGAGYGGLAAVVGNYEQPSSYTIYDLPDPLSLQRRFLSTACPSFEFGFDANATPRDVDLLVSSCALAELTDSGMETYGPLLSRATRGLITWDVTAYSMDWCSDRARVIDNLTRLTGGKQVTCAIDNPKFVAKFRHWAQYVYLWGPTE